MPTEKDPQDLETQTTTEVPAPSEPEHTDETPEEVDPVGTKEADAVAAGPEIKIDLPSEIAPPAEEGNDASKEADRGAGAAPGAEPGPEKEPDATDDPSGQGGEPVEPTDPGPSDIPAEPSPSDLGIDDAGDKPADGATDTDLGAGDGSADPEPSGASDHVDGKPEALTPELETSAEDPKGPPSSEEVAATDAEFEAPEPAAEAAQADAEPQDTYSGFHSDKAYMGAALGKDGTDQLLAAANKSFGLVELLRKVAGEAAEAERQEAQFLLGIGALWLSQLERWLARRS